MSHIGLIAISAKPYHAGHHMMVQQAAQENDAVVLFISLSDRSRSGEVQIRGQDMARIWKEHLADILPANVTPVYLVDESPVRRIYKVLGDANDNLGPESYYVYGDPDDIARNFKDDNIQAHLSNLHAEGRLRFRRIPRESTVDVSGTQMRGWLNDGNKPLFIQHLPMGVDGEAIWQLLRKRIESEILNSLV